MKCVICGNNIDIVGTWAEGHNAEPVAKGRCCSNCNNNVVMATRLKLYFKQR